MKNILLLVTAIIVFGSVSAQKIVPKIKAGTEVGYTVSMNGDSVLFSLNVNSIGDSVKMTWEVSKYGSGTYLMTAQSLENGNKMTLKAPEPDEITKLSESETMGFISKSAFKNMALTHVMQFDDLKYVLNTDTSSVIKINNKELDVLHATSADGKNEIWVLNNPDFPLICKTKNGAQGADMLLKYIR